MVCFRAKSGPRSRSVSVIVLTGLYHSAVSIYRVASEIPFYSATTSSNNFRMSLPDGAFPRVNAAMIQSGKFLDMIASVVGMPVSFDGDSTVEFECVDGGRVPVLVSPEFIFVPGKVMEIMGAVQADNSIQVRFYTRVCYLLCTVHNDVLCYFVTCDIVNILGNPRRPNQ